MNNLSGFVVLGTFFFSLQLKAQSKYIKPGVQLPSMSFSDVLNYKTDSINFNDFRSKFIILDFWNTACISCIKSFPLIDSLQKEYAGKVQFVLANRESKDSTIHFFEKRKSIHMPAVPMITNAKKLSDLFAVKVYPYTVWIDDTSRVKYFIASYNLSKHNLNQFISGKNISAKHLNKNVFRGGYFDPGRPDSLQSSILYYCYIARYDDDIDVSNSNGVNANQTAIRIACAQASIVDLYKRAYEENNKFRFNRPESVVLLVKDVEKYIRPQPLYERDAWFRENGYSFDMVLPITKKEEAYKIMQQQLNSYFGLSARVYSQYKDGNLLNILEIKE